MFRSDKYRPLPDLDDDEDTGDNHVNSSLQPRPNWTRQSSLSRAFIAIALIAIWLGTFCGGIVFDRVVLSVNNASKHLAVERTFNYEPIYGDAPSDTSNAAWLAMFPRSHGFFQTPGTKGLSVFSVFHQLHCTNVLRHSYYVARNASYLEYALQDISISRESIKHEHVVHCFDYLRQSLVCASDRAVEAVDVGRGGATGWGSVHVCRDHGETLAMVRKWEAHQSG